MPDADRDLPSVPPARAARAAAAPAAAAAVEDSHCSWCGARYPSDAGWPRRCAECGRWAYRNPLPVAVALVPVRDAAGPALVVIRRSIEPSRGRLALPGGFMEVGESWQQAVVRELAEETGIPGDAGQVALADALADEAGGYLLLFGLLPERPAAALPPPIVTDETDGHQLIHEPVELGFPLHTEAVRRWFAGGYPPAPRTRTA
ncbi:NUDIX domain-containing protein [Actinacidiphila rubida]|uniref:NUDIX domain-containing protein n=1 Tax=Actinacidiphila rubida TaxID=310780 RepID=A0A1H8QAF3_9ACTN|nr:NUDIX domain-containing protein [Actinacidiphila rubida]SEO51205.1 NUDIX domain-containing protein [Actinacidiphila rubida]